VEDLEKVNLKVNLEKFTDKMRKELTKYEAHIGILSGETHEDDDFSTASLGAVHEFGSMSEHIPSRSFFRLTEKAKGEEMMKFIKANEPAIIKACLNGGMEKIMQKIGAKWNAYLHECFETEGWGTWQELSDETLAARERKRSDKTQGGVKILQDTGALERSITFEVK
jgi:phage gpG-like protein